MCDALTAVAHDPSVPEPSRRRFLGVLGLAGAVGGMALTGAAALPATAQAAAPARSNARTRIVLLGTSGGPQMLGAERTGICTAIIHGDRCYIVDLGWGSTTRMVQAGLGGVGKTPGAVPFNTLSGVFVTHLHSDHFTEWPAMYLTGVVNSIGRKLPPVQVFGPGDRPTPPAVFPPTRSAPTLVGPGIGMAGMTEHLRLAFAADLNDRIRDQGMADPATLFQVHDIDLAGIPVIKADGVPPRLTRPIPVWEDGDVKVSATLVDHRPTAPSFAYRFDTPDGSIVISGDTTVSQNLIELAKDADYLVHEAIDPVAIERIVAPLPAAAAQSVKQHLYASHTTIEQVGRDVAERAGAKNLVLTHLSSGTSDATWKQAQKGYSGKVIVGEDLMQIGLGK